MDGVQDRIAELWTSSSSSSGSSTSTSTRGDKGSWSRDGETMESEGDLEMGPFRWDLQILRYYADQGRNQNMNDRNSIVAFQ